MLTRISREPSTMAYPRPAHEGGHPRHGCDRAYPLQGIRGRYRCPTASNWLTAPTKRAKPFVNKSVLARTGSRSIRPQLLVRPDGVLDDIPTFTMEELRAIVDEAHREKTKLPRTLWR